MQIKFRWLLPGAFLGSVLFSFSALTIFSDRLPTMVTNVLSLPLVPHLFLNPIFVPLGLSKGEWMAWPTPMGYLIGSLFYGILLFVIGRWIDKRKKRDV